MTGYIYLATSIGLFILTPANGNWNIVGHTLTDTPLTGIIASEGVILAGTAEGIWRTFSTLGKQRLLIFLASTER
ncbi:MAG: hypothetical protein R6V60_19805 [Desulfobacterales bacterium]